VRKNALAFIQIARDDRRVRSRKDPVMRRFKLPLIVTGIAFVLMVAIAIGGMILIAQSGASNREKEARAQALGSGSATLLCMIVAPFWLFEAAKIGKERRAAKQMSVQRRDRLAQSVQNGSPSLPPRRR
jgi:hypothetical protein